VDGSAIATYEVAEVALADTFRALHPDAREVGTFHGFQGAATGDKIDAVLASQH
jgi:hypothetical protein